MGIKGDFFFLTEKKNLCICEVSRLRQIETPNMQMFKDLQFLKSCKLDYDDFKDNYTSHKAPFCIIYQISLS